MKKRSLRWLLIAGVVSLSVPVVNYLFPADDLEIQLVRVQISAVALGLGLLFLLIAAAIYGRRHWSSYVTNSWDRAVREEQQKDSDVIDPNWI